MAKSNKVVATVGKSHLSNKDKEFLINNSLEVETDHEKIVAPSFLDKEMKEKFYFLADELIKLNIFTHLDVDTLAQYVFNITQYEKISEILINIPMVGEEYSEMIKLQEKFFKMSRAGANELGLNILSRNKLIVPKQEVKTNKFDEF